MSARLRTLFTVVFTLLLALHWPTAQAACTMQIGPLTADPMPVVAGNTVSITFTIDYQGCKGVQASVRDNNPTGLSYAGCSSDSVDWNCNAVTTVSGVTTSRFTADNNGVKSSVLTLIYTATSVGSRSITITGNPSGGSRTLSFPVTPGSPPTVSTTAASGIASGQATLNGSVTSNGTSTTVTFEYGPTVAYGSTVTASPSPLAGSAVGIAVSATLSGLPCGSTYQFRAKGVNTAGTVNGGNLSFSTPACGPDHYELSLPTGSLSCLPTTVTVTACADSSKPCTSPATSFGGATATLSTTAGALASGSLTFNASGVATTTLSFPAAAQGSSVSVTLSGESAPATSARQCCPNGGSCVTANACSTTFSTAGFIVASAAGGVAAALPTQTAGTASATHFLRAVRSSSTTQACEAALSGPRTVNWAYECNDPASCSGSNLMSVTGSATAPAQRNDNGTALSYLPVAMNFDANGNAAFSFNFADVGRVALWASTTVNGATLTGGSNTFVVKPAGFAFGLIQQTAAPNLANPAAADAAGARFVRAGENFNAIIRAVSSSGATTPNYGKESAAEGLLLTPTLVLPGGGVAGALGNATIAGGSFSNGVASATNLSYSEVGIITLTPSVADGSYLGTGNVTGSASANVGRFFPDRFALGGASITQRASLACSPVSAFSYLGENFRVAVTLTAQNTAGATTQNYSGAFAKFDPTNVAAWNLAGVDGGTVFSTASGRLSLGAAAGSWSNGVAAGVTLTAQGLRAAAPDGPFNAAFGIAPVDADGVALASHDLDVDPLVAGNDRRLVGSVALRFGRLRMASAIGAADRPLALPVTVEHWDGSRFVTNTLDSCTTVAASAVSFGNLRRTLTTADTGVAAAITVAAGTGSLRLAAPMGGRSGTADVTLSLGSAATDASCLQPWTPGAGDAATAGANLSHLRGAWCSASFDKDPSARASFGLPRGHDGWVYRRENY